jgi:Zn-dependent M28 family amino/carboxypeptidase
VIFIGFSGEEQGLIGSRAYVKSLLERGEKSKIKGVINMDMIGYSADSELDCLLETSAANEALTTVFAEAAQQFTELRIVTSFHYWGSDHVPFIDNDMPALLTIENDYGSYPAYHRSSDQVQNISIKMGLETLKMNAAVLGNWLY